MPVLDTAKQTNKFSKEKNIKLMSNPAYSLDLAPWDIFYSQKLRINYMVNDFHHQKKLSKNARPAGRNVSLRSTTAAVTCVAGSDCLTRANEAAGADGPRTGAAVESTRPDYAFARRPAIRHRRTGKAVSLRVNGTVTATSDSIERCLKRPRLSDFNAPLPSHICPPRNLLFRIEGPPTPARSGLGAVNDRRCR
ncbi:hypothetical protein EVAR_20602_1 [Eumeta japonica]|uniref:Uncharacterized protein n=1 Tax=Eumeta variegata TaxID=151549 RepID=A0A4C1USD9_EUMVA|nr:hypothetical protein EVAR_20602_1 [Eumeta japonica]